MKRRYDKGERRFKHIGRGSRPEFETTFSHPQRWVGKCPSELTLTTIQSLLDDAVAVPAPDREIAAPKRLYAVHEGAIYEAQTSDGGASYHGYPYRGRLGSRLLDVLRGVARDKGCLDEFENWSKQYIVTGGDRR